MFQEFTSIILHFENIMWLQSVNIYILPNVGLFSILKFIFICFSVCKLCPVFRLKRVQNVRVKILRIKLLATPCNHCLNSSTTIAPPKIKMHVNRWALPWAQKVSSLRPSEPCSVVSRSQACPEDCVTSAGQNSLSGPDQPHPVWCQHFSSVVENTCCGLNGYFPCIFSVIMLQKDFSVLGVYCHKSGYLSSHIAP